MKGSRRADGYEIRWRPEEGKNHLYGSLVNFRKSGAVSIHNPLLPSGTVIHEWASHRDYGKEQILADLPLLEKGRQYRFRLSASSYPEDTVWLRVNWFDRFQEKIRSEVIRSEETIRYPEDGESYTAELIWAGAESCIFEHFCIRKVSEGCRPV